MAQISDAEVVARTILREAYEKGGAAYTAVAYCIYNRLRSGANYGGSTARALCLAKNQFAVWRSVWDSGVVPANPQSLTHRDYGYCAKLAANLVAGREPVGDASGKHAYCNFRTDSAQTRSAHPAGMAIGGNWFF